MFAKTSFDIFQNSVSNLELNAAVHSFTHFSFTSLASFSSAGGSVKLIFTSMAGFSMISLSTTSGGSQLETLMMETSAMEKVLCERRELVAGAQSARGEAIDA